MSNAGLMGPEDRLLGGGEKLETKYLEKNPKGIGHRVRKVFFNFQIWMILGCSYKHLYLKYAIVKSV